MNDLPSGVEEHRNRVASSLGHFLLAFNQVDLMTQRALAALCDEPMLWGIASREWEFERRRGLVVELLEWKKIAAPELIKQWKSDWQAAKEIAAKRNDVAHGHISMLGPADAPVDQRFGIASFKRATSGKSVNFDFNKPLQELESLLPETLQLVGRLEALLSEADKCPWRDQLIPKSKLVERSE